MNIVGSSGENVVAAPVETERGAAPIPAWPLQLGASAGIGLILWIAYGGGYVSLDAMWSLAWGRDLAAAAPLAQSGTTTPHVLSNLLGAVLSPLGSNADHGLVAVEFLAAGALVWLTGLLAREIAGVVAGVVAGLLMALREQLLYATTSTFLDVLVATFVVWAALLVVRGLRGTPADATEPAGTGEAAEARRPSWPRPPASPTGAFLLLLLAGLLRPEAWVLSGFLWLWCWRGGDGDLAATVRRAALVASAPLAWLVFDAALNGDALYSVHETNRVNALVRAGKEIPDTLKEHVVSIPRNIAHAAGPEIIVAVLVVAVVLLWPALGRRRPLQLVVLPAAQRGPVLVLLVGSLLYAAVLAAEALSGSLLFARFGIALTGLLIAVTAVGLVAIERRLLAGRRATVPGAPVVVLTLILAAAQLPLLVDARRITGEEHDRYAVARAAITPGVPCEPIAVPNTNIRAYVAVWADVRGDDVIDASRQPTLGRATFITAAGDPEKLLRDPSFPQLEAFPAAPLVRERGGWRITSTCQAGR